MKTDNNMFRIGILGAGHIAEKMAATVREMPDIEAYAIAARQYDRAAAFASRFGFTKAYGSYEELVSDKDIDLVYVATPHSLHYEHVKLCLEHGKAVLCEKAFMANASEAEEVIRMSETNGIFLAEAIWTRYMPFQRTVKELIDKGAIGKPMMLSAHLGYHVSGKERIVRPELGGGALLDLGVYALNFAIMMFGDDIEHITSDCIKSDTGVDLQNCIVLKYSDGRMADLHSTALCSSDRQGIICGDRGYVVCDNINNMLNAFVYDKDHNLVRTLNAPAQITGFEYQVRACKEAISAGMVETVYMPHSETLRIMKIMDSLRASWGVVFPNDR